MKTEQYSITLKSFIVYSHIRTRHASNVIWRILAYCHTIIDFPSFEVDPSCSDDRLM